MADTFYLCIVVLRYPLKYIVNNNETFAYMQLVVYPLHQTAQTITIWMMVLVTIDRYIFVCHPLRAGILTGYRCRRLTSAGIFLIAALYNLPHYFSQCVMIVHDPCSDRVFHKVLYQEKFNNIHYYYIYRYALCIALLYIGPLSLLVFLNYKMIQVIKKSTRWRNEAHNYRRHSCAHSDDKNATFTLIIIVMVFVVCETPELLFKITTLVSPHIKTLDQLLTTYVIYRFGPISELLTVINSSVNFFIYCAFSRRFLSTMKGLFVRRGRLQSMTTQELMGLRDLGGGAAGGGGGGHGIGGDTHVQGQLCQG